MLQRSSTLKNATLAVLAVLFIGGAGFAIWGKTHHQSSSVDQKVITTAAESAVSNSTGPDLSHLAALSSRTYLAASPQLYTSLNVVDSTGKKVTLDVQKTPMLFLTMYDPRQDFQALAQAWNTLKNKPTIISTGWPTGMKMNEVISDTNLLLNSAGLKDVAVYYLSGNPYGKYVTGLPDTYVWQDNEVYHVAGVFTNASDWQSVFNGHLKLSDKQ